MMLGIGKEAVIFLYAGLSGIVLFAGYQILIVFRKIFRHSAGVINAEDFIYWLLVSAYLFRQMYRTTHGNIRWFFVLGVVLGSLTAFFCKTFLTEVTAKCKKILEKHEENR